MAGEISPISSRKSVPPSACLKRPSRLPGRSGEGALLVAEELTLEERLGERRAVELDEGAFARGLFWWIACATSSLPVPLSPGDEHARLGRRDLLDDVEDLLHRGARADDVVEAELVVQARAKLDRLVLEVPALERAIDDEHELVDLERLGEVVLCALRGEVPGPARVGFEPVEHVVGIVVGQVVADKVAAAVGVRSVDAIEQLHEGMTAAFLRREPEDFSVAHVIGAHQTERAVADVLVLAPHGCPGSIGKSG